MHVLTCKTTRDRNDWSLDVVMILGHRFCEDFVGYETATAINISGPVNSYISICTHALFL